MMVSSECADAVNEALHAIERDEDLLWSLPLVTALELQSEGKALDWSCAVMSETLRASESGISGRQEWLAELLELKRSFVVSVDLERRAREIWYHDNSRDEVQTAIARLYEALAALRSDDFSAYRKCVAVAVGIASGSDAANDRKVRRAIKLFREHCEAAQSQDRE